MQPEGLVLVWKNEEEKWASFEAWLDTLTDDELELVVGWLEELAGVNALGFV